MTLTKFEESSGDKKLECQICGAKRKSLVTHIRNSNDHPSWEKYKEMYPDTEAFSEDLAEDLSGILKGYRFEKGHEPWNKGKTKEKDERVKKYSEKIRPWNKGKTKEEDERIEKIAQASKGQEPPNKNQYEMKCVQCGKTFSVPKSRTEGQHKRRFCSHECYGKWKSESGQSLKSLLEIKDPNSLEQKIIKIIENNNLPFKYVGDGKVVLGGRCPDFIHTDGQKKIIEAFGDYFHDPDLNETVEWERTEEGRKEFFKEFGFDTLVLWQSDLEEMSNKEIANKIRKFTRGVDN